MLHRLTRRTFGIAAAAFAVAVPAAGAHVQVTPTTVAPGDPVEVTVLVPNESDASTTGVDLQIPKGVLVFSVADTDGWKRRNVDAADGSIGEINWRGKLASGTYVKFTFLASMPDEPGEIAWKALQTYDDGENVRWVGAAGTEYPAAVTKVDASTPRQNAGGEGAGDENAEAADAGANVAFDDDTSDDASTDDGGNAETIAYVALALGIVAVLLSGLTLLRRRRS